MRFGVMTLIDHVPDARSGHRLSPTERFREAVELAVPAEELVCDATPASGRKVSPGERHGPPQFFSADTAGSPFARRAEVPHPTAAEMPPQLRHALPTPPGTAAGAVPVAEPVR